MIEISDGDGGTTSKIQLNPLKSPFNRSQPLSAMPTLTTNQIAPESNVECGRGMGAEGQILRGSFPTKAKRGLKDLQKMPSVKI